MEVNLLRSHRLLVCRACRKALVTPSSHASLRTPSEIAKRTGLPAPILRYASNRSSVQTIGNDRSKSDHGRRLPKSNTARTIDVDLARASAAAILKHPSIPSDAETEAALNEIDSLVDELVSVNFREQSRTVPKTRTPAAAILALDASSAEKQIPTSKPDEDAVNELSSLAFKIIKHPPVFVTDKALSTYVSIQSKLQRPATFPEVFVLYASKPQPSLANKSDPTSIQYTSQSEKAIAAAIPAHVANMALVAATTGPSRSLPLALNIINETFRAPAFRRAKLFRRALPPAAGAALAPFAAYTLASQLSEHQTALPPESFTGMAFAGMFTYVATVGTIGYVALTTSNDQMLRVTWAVGMPLWERWVREEERAAADAVALAWGFKETWRWGEEEGEEWEGLKEWMGVRGMIVDKIGLMEGME